MASVLFVLASLFALAFLGVKLGLGLTLIVGSVIYLVLVLIVGFVIEKTMIVLLCVVVFVYAVFLLLKYGSDYSISPLPILILLWSKFLILVFFGLFALLLEIFFK